MKRSKINKNKDSYFYCSSSLH